MLLIIHTEEAPSHGQPASATFSLDMYLSNLSELRKAAPKLVFHFNNTRKHPPKWKKTFTTLQPSCWLKIIGQKQPTSVSPASWNSMDATGKDKHQWGFWRKLVRVVRWSSKPSSPSFHHMVELLGVCCHLCGHQRPSSLPQGAQQVSYRTCT